MIIWRRWIEYMEEVDRIEPLTSSEAAAMI
jgi:hypothetical protein